MSVNQIALSTSHHQTFSSEEKGQVAPVESVESRVQKILSEIFGRDIAQIISVYHRLRNITSPPPILYNGGLKSVDLSCAQISNELLGQLDSDIDILNMNGSLFKRLNFSKFTQLKYVLANESLVEEITWKEFPQSVRRCDFNRCDMRKVLSQLPKGLLEISLKGSEFRALEVSRFEGLQVLCLSQDSFLEIDFRKLNQLRELVLHHDGEEPFKADFSNLFDQLSEKELNLLEIDGYVLSGVDFSKLHGNLSTIFLRRTDLRKTDMTSLPSYLNCIILDRCKLNRDSLIQLPKNLYRIRLIDCTLIKVDLCHFPASNYLTEISFRKCIFDGKGFPLLAQGLQVIFFHEIDFTKVDLFQLPEKTEHLFFNQCTFGEKGLSLFAKSLKTLSFERCDLDITFSQLHKNLEGILLTGCHLKNLHSSLFFKGLKSLSLRRCHFKDLDCTLLPESLKTLTLCECDFVNGDFSLLSKGLEEIAFYRCDFTNVDFFQLTQKTRQLFFSECTFSRRSLTQPPEGIKKIIFRECHLADLDRSQLDGFNVDFGFSIF